VLTRQGLAEAKKFPLSHNIMRHKFIPMFVARFRSIGEAALQACNSEGTIRKHSLELKTTEEAEQLFGILPKHISNPVVPDTAAAPMPAAPSLSVAA
jgi:hypothetical protein